MNINFDKNGGLIPAIIQDFETGKVLMLGYMNRASYAKTRQSGKVTFFSRSRKQLWTKGETSGNFLKVKDIKIDCDGDTLLLKVRPTGPVCHTGSDTCFGENNQSDHRFLYELEELIRDRKNNPKPDSYTCQLFAAGSDRIAQKVGEEAIETVVAALSSDQAQLKAETADLIYHLLVLLAQNQISLKDIVEILFKRHNK